MLQVFFLAYQKSMLSPQGFYLDPDILNDFKPKGRPGKHKEHKSLISKMITKERASRLEGSFGTDKEYFLLKKIKARTKEAKRLWIFIGIHTANALNIGKRKTGSLAQAA